MNAKKIMGAVLVALLAAALFVGAGAATDKTDMGVVFINEILDPAKYVTGTWTSGANTIAIVSTNGGIRYFDGAADFVEGVYENSSAKVTLKFPTATLTGVATSSGVQYKVIGGTYYGGSVSLSAATASTNQTVGNNLQYKITYPNGSVITQTGPVTQTTLADLGQYTIQPVFDKTYFADGTPSDLLCSKAVYTVTVADSNEVTISADAETVVESGVVVVTINAKPGKAIALQAEKLTFVSVNGNTSAVQSDNHYANFVMPNTGVAKVYAQAGTTLGTGKILETTEDESISFTIVAGEITGKTDKDSYFIGDKVVLTGTSTAGNDLNVYLEGTNIALTNINQSIDVMSDGTWKKELTYDDLKKEIAGKTKLDAGTYTIYISNKDSWDAGFVTQKTPANPKASEIKTYTTISVVLKQPFLSITDAPAVAVKGNDYKVTGIAEATDYIYAYIFGTNFFAAKTNNNTPMYTADLGGIANDDFTISVDKNEFTIEFAVPETGMAAGQYFMVVQHPMYDGFFNIWANGSDITTAPTVGTQLVTANKTVLFDVSDRQSANAAQALCDALDTQNIDDMYVKLSFVVANGVSTINPIPAEITKGSKLTVSGTSNIGPDKIVTVEILSTAFAAVPKETVGSASFIALTTKTDEDGNWEVTFDTTGLNVDEYVVSATVEGFDATTAKINVIEGAPTEQPTENPTEQPTQTEQPTEAPATPGFGALAALAGLGAVAVLLLRRE